MLFQMRVLRLLLEYDAAVVRLLVEVDEAEVVSWLQVLKCLIDQVRSHLLVDNAIEVDVSDEDDAALKNIVVAEVLVDSV